MNKRRVVVTGAGVVSSLGNSVEALWAALLAGKSGVRTMPEWQDDLPNQLAAPVALDRAEVMKIDRKKRRSMGKLAMYAALAAQEAVKNSAISPEDLSSGRCGCAVSSTSGSSSESENSFQIWKYGNRELMPAMQFFRSAPNSAAFNTANLFGITGVQLSPSAACASGMQSVGAAYEAIAFGRQEVMLAGGADELAPMVNGTFDQLFAQAPATTFPPQKTSRPFDASREGLVCSEGAGILVLEELEHALTRSAPILFEIVGYATNCSGVHLSQSERGAIAACVRTALADASISPDMVDYVSAHATGTKQGDAEEAAGLAEVFGGGVPTSSLKGHLGHTLAASGPIELAAVAKMVATGKLVPTLNLEKVAENCACIRHVQPGESADIGYFVKNSFAFGGINAVLVGKKFKQ